MIKYFLSLLIFISLANGTVPGPQEKPPFSYKVYGNFANFFESENDLLTFFEFKKGDVVAEIGAANGENIAGIGILCDSLTLYAQDINAKALNQENFDKVIKHCRKYKSPVTCKFNWCIGTEKASLLPDAAFDKIILSATFHEFYYMDDMIADIAKKLKQNGRLYILESHCGGEGHKNYTADEASIILKKYHFSFVKKDGKDLNGSKGLYRLIFVKH